MQEHTLSTSKSSQVLAEHSHRIQELAYGMFLASDWCPTMTTVLPVLFSKWEKHACTDTNEKQFLGWKTNASFENLLCAFSRNLSCCTTGQNNLASHCLLCKKITVLTLKWTNSFVLWTVVLKDWRSRCLAETIWGRGLLICLWIRLYAARGRLLREMRSLL